MKSKMLTVLAFSAIFAAQTAVANDDANVAAYLSAMEAGGEDDWLTAKARVIPAGETAQMLVRWHALRDGHGSFADYYDFITNHSDWPSQITLTRRGERYLDQAPNPQAVVNYFFAKAPRTADGIISLYAAYTALGNSAKAEEVLVTGWTDHRLEIEDQKIMVEMMGDKLKPHMIARVDELLWNGKTKVAEPLLDFLPSNYQALAEARIALRRRASDGVDKEQKVPLALATEPSLRLEQFLRAVRRSKDEAVDIALEQSHAAAGLGQPDKWANQRRSMVRYEMREGDAWRAYRLASKHFLTPDDGHSFSDLEWLSGYIALRKLNDPELALKHFDAFQSSIESPISVARAGYWRGLALEALNRIEESNAALRMAATQQTAFYGLLAAEKLGQPMDTALLGKEKFPDWRTSKLVDEPLIKVAKLFYDAGNTTWALINLIHFAETQDRETLGMMADMALDWGEPFLALHIAKIGAQRGIVINRAYFPLHPLAKMDLASTPEFAMSITRRESEFNTMAQSGVGARGMMQLMPDTAKAVAADAGLDYELSKLTGDWRYNVTLGSNYLAELETEFGPSPVMISAAYNAGPSRPQDWMRNIGDPRLGEIDVIDWIEQIPFRETRNYVMRVTESLPVYRARLSGKTEPIQFTKLLIGEKPVRRPTVRPVDLMERHAAANADDAEPEIATDEPEVTVRRGGVVQPSTPSRPTGPRPVARPSAPASQ